MNCPVVFAVGLPDMVALFTSSATKSWLAHTPNQVLGNLRAQEVAKSLRLPRAMCLHLGT